VGREGARGVLVPSMSDGEWRDFEHSVATLRDAVAGLGAA